MSSTSVQAAQLQTSYMPFQYQQHAYGQQPQQAQTQHEAQQQPPHASVNTTAPGQATGHQQAQAGFTPAADFNQELQLSQQASGLKPTTFGGQLDWRTQSVVQPAVTAAVGQAAQNQAEIASGSVPSGITTSQGQQANQWRQAANKKGSALLDLVPNVAKQCAPKQTANSSPLRSAAQYQAQVQADTDQQGCEAFKPAVQQAIASAGLPLSKPFYQQAVKRAMEQHTQHAADQGQAGPSKLVQKQTTPSLEAQDHAMTPADDSASKQQEAEQTQQPASPTPSDGAILGMEIVEEEEMIKARAHISARQWLSASICGKPLTLICKVSGLIVQLKLHVHIPYNIMASMHTCILQSTVKLLLLIEGNMDQS